MLNNGYVPSKEAGFKMVLLTAKHHDGFCLWPTATTKHSVASSPWKNGQGDVVKELRAACDKYDMKFGYIFLPGTGMRNVMETLPVTMIFLFGN